MWYLEIILWYTEVIESKELNFFISRYSILIIEMLWWCYFRWKNVGQKVTKEIRFWFTTFFFLASVPTNRLSLIYYTDRWEKEIFWCIEVWRHIWFKILLSFSMRKKIIEGIWCTRISSSLNDFCYHKILIVVISSNYTN